jgi:predicted dehydrogenase
VTSRARTEPVRIGVVGTGFAASSHLEALRRIPEVEVVAVAGRDPKRTAALAARHGVQAHAGYAELVEDPGIDAVHNCTINRLHHEVNLAALEHGKHVLSEKPLAMDTTESSELAAAADKALGAGVLTGVCFNYRHYPMVAELREQLRGGEHGTPHFVHGHYLQDWLLLESDWNWRVQPAEGGASRAVADIGSHWGDLVQHVTGDEITAVLADLATLHSSRMRPTKDRSTFSAATDDACEPVAIESEDFGTVLVRFASGARGSFTLSQVSAGSKNGLRLRVDAAQSAFTWEQEQPERLWVGRRSAPNLELVRDPATLSKRAARLTQLPAGHPEGWFDALRNVFADFYGAVAARRAGEAYETDVASFRDGHARVQLVEAIMASAHEERWTRVHAGTAIAT